MPAKEKLHLDVKWASRQRLQYIEIMAYYTGRVTRSDVAEAFGLSDAAATKDLKLYNSLAPDNLLYKHNVFGFVPATNFKPVFTDLSPARILPMLAKNLAVAGGPYGEESIYGIETVELALPTRLPEAALVAQITRSICEHRKCQVHYHSLSNKNDDNENRERIIEPHSLVNTGLRWHVRAYSDDSYDFRDFVLSRFSTAQSLDALAESSAQYDDDWMEKMTLKLAPHPDLNKEQQASLQIDYAAEDGIISLTVKRALIGYALQKLSVDITHDHSMNPSAYQLILVNRDEIEPYAAWLFN